LEFFGDPDDETVSEYYNPPWSIDVRRSPETLLFWIDFFGGYDLDNYSV
jgi:hypothetical protein